MRQYGFEAVTNVKVSRASPENVFLVNLLIDSVTLCSNDISAVSVEGIFVSHLLQCLDHLCSKHIATVFPYLKKATSFLFFLHF